MITSYSEISQNEKIGKRVNYNIGAVADLAKREEQKNAIGDEIKRLLLCIDVQNDFMEGGSLAVPGSLKDVERINNFIYKNLYKITKIACSMDTHQMYQIFFPSWWKDVDGNEPEPYTIITLEDVESGKWIPHKDKDLTLRYLRDLKDTGKRMLCIWPYHCIEGSIGRDLENEFRKMVCFHDIVRKAENVILPKGMHQFSEMYGIVKPESLIDPFFNEEAINLVRDFDEIYVVGEAKSHCVLDSVKQLLLEFADNKYKTSRIIVLKDCMSSIPGYEEETEREFEELKSTYNIRIENSEDIVL